MLGMNRPPRSMCTRFYRFGHHIQSSRIFSITQKTYPLSSLRPGRRLGSQWTKPRSPPTHTALRTAARPWHAMGTARRHARRGSRGAGSRGFEWRNHVTEPAHHIRRVAGRCLQRPCRGRQQAAAPRVNHHLSLVPPWQLGTARHRDASIRTQHTAAAASHCVLQRLREIAPRHTAAAAESALRLRYLDVCCMLHASTPPQWQHSHENSAL